MGGRYGVPNGFLGTRGDLFEVGGASRFGVFDGVRVLVEVGGLVETGKVRAPSPAGQYGHQAVTKSDPAFSRDWGFHPAHR